MATQVNSARHDASSGALAKTATLTTAKPPTRAWKAIAPVAVAIVLALLPVPSGLPHHAWYFFSIFVGVIVGLVLEPLVALQLEQIGRLTRREIILAAIVVLSLVLWIVGGPFVSATTVAFIAISLMLITRVVTWSDITDDKRAWTTFAWLGALIALCDGLNRVGFVKWFADGISAHMKDFSPHLAMVILLAVFFAAHYLFASVDAYTTALLPVILLTGASIPGVPVKEFALLLCMELGIMGIITPFADAASPIYANSGYLPAKDYWRLGTIFGAIFLIFFLAIGVPWASLLWGK
jgi:L-tartrate/succinate antiporter